MADTTPMVRERAYYLWEKAGRPHGREHEFWAQAVTEIEGEQLLLHKNAHGVPVPPSAPPMKAPRVRKSKVVKDSVAVTPP